MIGAVITRGFTFSVALIVTAGFASAAGGVLPPIKTAQATLIQPGAYSASLIRPGDYEAMEVQE